jgi:serine/threonine-protein kinase/endoribonuclease IRE1
VDDPLETPTPGKKKARRGCRGGSKHKKRNNASKSEDGDGIDQTVREVMQIGGEPPLEPQPVEVNTPASHSVADVSGPVTQIGHLRVNTDTILGFGSHGTVVYKGSFGGRDVAVKRMLQEFYDIASHEVGLLQESDDHPNVIRYYDKESAGDFLYIALELCPASLQDVIEKPNNYPLLIGPNALDLPDVLKQITAGVRYLHSLKIVHRDIKPQNILVSAPKKLPAHPDTFQPPRLLISDFGLCKKLEGDQSSFRATTAHAAGTSGWRAPELLVDEDLASSPPSLPPSTHSTSEPLIVDPQTNRRATRAIDIFSLGCVFYYVLTGGNHPFDSDGKYMREANIVKGRYSIDDLSVLGDYQWEAKDLVMRMLHHEPRARPSAAEVLTHPFFWTADERLDFLCLVSDIFEFEPRDPPSAALVTLESHAPSVLREWAMDFQKPLPKEFKDTLGKQRKYQGQKLLDMLRALRNKKNHYEDMPEAVKRMVGSVPDGYLGFWTRRFPGLLMACHAVVVECGWEGRDRFRRFYGGS